VVVGTVINIVKSTTDNRQQTTDNRQQTVATSPALLIMGEVVSANGYAEQLAEQSVQQLMSVASMV
jgi:type III secretory pathway component EscS